jgi:hypothetical protein
MHFDVLVRMNYGTNSGTIAGENVRCENKFREGGSEEGFSEAGR